MSAPTPRVTLDPEQLNNTDAGILDVLHDGRITPRYAAGELDKQQPYINQRLKRLLEHGHVRRVDRGLYELVEDPRSETDAGDQERTGRPKGPDDLAPGEDPPEVRLSDNQREMLRDRLAGSGSALMARVDAVEAMYRELRRLGEAEKADLLEVVDVDATAYQSERSVWSNVVKGQDTLSALPGVEAPATGMSTWRYSRGDDE